MKRWFLDFILENVFSLILIVKFYLIFLLEILLFFILWQVNRYIKMVIINSDELFVNVIYLNNLTRKVLVSLFFSA